MVLDWSIKPLDWAIFTAVSCLSPVNTQTFIPASTMWAIVSGTPCCNLSSIAVVPVKLKLFSKFSTTLSTSFYLSGPSSN